MSTELLAVERRITTVEAKLDRVLEILQANEAADWVSRQVFCRGLGISERHMTDLISWGIFDKTCLKNVGTAKRPRYQFHRKKATEAYLNQYR